MDTLAVQPNTGDEIARQRQDRLATEKEVARLSNVLQSLTRSALPLGKLMDFIQEDLEAMQAEHERWQAEEKRLRSQLQTETRYYSY
ncbi:unnamed protein product [Protopolystoma xenopodis]|uniref:TRAF3-interacting protein 1 C-terminal domain-containing protein n=1 Tax=Protopolystoma xenopodis TaxID=117903 RepID=A0A3S5A537_9PLAT|nr:unnamed protein product [Protopolystoma xenopodis]